MRKVKKCKAKRKNYKVMCRVKDNVIYHHEQKIKRMQEVIDDFNKDILSLKHDNQFLYQENKNMKKDLLKINRLYIDTYNTMQEIDAKRAELVRENNLLHDTLKSYKIPLHKKSWAEIKYQVKAWVKKFDEK